MIFTHLRKNRKDFICIFLLLMIILQFNFLVYYALAKQDKNVSGSSKKGRLDPDDSVSYRFENNNQFEIKTNVGLEFDIEYAQNIQNREITMSIRNDNLLSLQVRIKQSLEDFGIDNLPESPKKDGNKLITRYRCIYQIESNTSIDKITLTFKKDLQSGLDPLIEYALAIYEEDDNSWELLDTEEISVESGVYLKSSLTDLDGDTDYYITIFEVSYLSYILIIIISAIGVLALVVIISKKDYLYYLRTRTTPIETGAHRLTLDEVLENENRNKIIDLILKEPGIHFNELLRRTELAPGNLVWHLDILETYKIIGKKRVSNFIAYFPYYDKNPITNLDLKLSKSKLTLEILEMIELEPGIYNNIITKRKEVDHKTIQYHVKKLSELGLIYIKKEGKKKKIYPNLDAEYFKNLNNNGE